MVIITYLPWHDTFLKFLNVLGELRRTSKDEFQQFLSEAYSMGVPEPGACLKLFYNSALNVSKNVSQFNHIHDKLIQLNLFTFVPELRLSTSITVSVAQHSTKSQFKFVLQLR